MRCSMQKITLLCLLFFSTFTHALTIDKIIVFGDSLSDNGNIYALTQRASHIIPNLDPLPKSPPYYKGRFSNGMVWVEYLSQSLNVPLHDYAFGGSWAEPFYDSRTIIPFSLASQVYIYLGDTPDDFARDKHLFVIWSGGNDYAKGRDDIEYATSNTVAAIRKQMDLLIHAGGRHFLVLTLPDLGTAPGVVKRGKRISHIVSELSRLHNQKMIKMIKLVKKEYPNVDFILFNMTNHMNDVKSYPAKYKLKNLTEPCYHGSYTLENPQALHALQASTKEAMAKANIDVEDNLSLQTVYLNGLTSNASQCINPDEYMFWDNIHPTSRMHQLIAEAVYNVVIKTT